MSWLWRELNLNYSKHRYIKWLFLSFASFVLNKTDASNCFIACVYWEHPHFVKFPLCKWSNHSFSFFLFSPKLTSAVLNAMLRWLKSVIWVILHMICQIVFCWCFCLMPFLTFPMISGLQCFSPKNSCLFPCISYDIDVQGLFHFFPANIHRWRHFTPMHRYLSFFCKRRMM